MEKAPDAFRTISEVASEIDVPQHVLRFWESRFPQIRPMKRGGGRRYYRPDDVDLLRGIRHLLYGEGYTIRGVQRILREQGMTVVQTVWRVDAELPPSEEDQTAEASSAQSTE
ncbi:MAG: MerR family transcriptional regulator, partial [Xanthobacteraceae bacterium]